MRTAPLPLTQDDLPYLACVPRGDGTATLYEAGDTPPAYLVLGPPSAPAVSARQIRLALNQMGLRDAVETAISAGPRDLRDWWEYSVELHREHPMIATMAEAIGATPAQVDALWQLGAGL